MHFNIQINYCIFKIYIEYNDFSQIQIVSILKLGEFESY